MYGPKIRHGAYLIENCVNTKSFTVFVLSLRFGRFDCEEIHRIYFYDKLKNVERGNSFFFLCFET